MNTLLEALRELKPVNEEKVQESLLSSFPIQFPNKSTIVDEIQNIPAGEPFEVGYVRTVPLKAGPTHEGTVAIKCEEFWGTTGEDYLDIRRNRYHEVDPRRKGEITGFAHSTARDEDSASSEEQTLRNRNRIGSYRGSNGGIKTDVLQIYPLYDRPHREVFFISRAGGDWEEISREELQPLASTTKSIGWTSGSNLVDNDGSDSYTVVKRLYIRNGAIHDNPFAGTSAAELTVKDATKKAAEAYRGIYFINNVGFQALQAETWELFF